VQVTAPSKEKGFPLLSSRIANVFLSDMRGVIFMVKQSMDVLDGK
jgi:hypothetical protein